MDSNASRAREVERKVWKDNDFLLPGKLRKRSPLVDGQSALSTRRKWGQGAFLLLALEQLRCLQSARASTSWIVSPSFTEQLRVWPHVPPPFRYFRATSTA